MKKNREVICAFAAWVLSACFFMSCFMIPGLAEKINSLGNSNMLVYGMSLILFCLLFVVGMGIAHRHEVAGKTFPEMSKPEKSAFWLMPVYTDSVLAALYLRRDGTAWICGGEIRMAHTAGSDRIIFVFGRTCNLFLGMSKCLLSGKRR